MKVKKSERLKIVLELAERDELEATEAVKTVQLHLQEEQQRLLELKAYYKEYETAFSKRRTAIRASDIAKERDFLAGLTRLQNQQAQQIALIEKGLAKKLETWRACHLKQQSLERLIKRLKAEENLILDKLEQQMLDEWFSRIG